MLCEVGRVVGRVSPSAGLSTWRHIWFCTEQYLRAYFETLWGWKGDLSSLLGINLTRAAAMASIVRCVCTVDLTVLLHECNVTTRRGDTKELELESLVSAALNKRLIWIQTQRHTHTYTNWMLSTHTHTLTECYLSVQFIFLLKIVLKYSTWVYILTTGSKLYLSEVLV